MSDAELNPFSGVRLPDTMTDYRSRLYTVVFGDRRGLTLFLGALCALMLLVRVGIFITDTYTVANAFVALTDSHIAVEQPYYGSSLDTPGMRQIGDVWYGRNYGQIVASLPVYVGLSALSVVADLRIALIALWSLLLLAFAVQLGTLFDRKRTFTVGGAVVSVSIFFANAAMATPLDPRLTHVLALQLTSLVAGALLAVVTYRLVTFLSGPRVGIVAGVLTVFATPVGFWAPIPKRHVFTTLLVLVALFAFAKSRDPDTHRRDLVHGSAYAAIGLLAWIHAPEALVLFTTLVLVDLVSSPLARLRAIPVILGVFLLSLIPFFFTNYLISGHPFVPPRLLRVFDVGEIGGGVNGGGGSPSNGGGGSPGTSDPTGSTGGQAATTASSGATDAGGPDPLALFRGLLDGVLAAVATFLRLLQDGFDAVLNRTDQLYRTFIRSGFVPDYGPASDEAINLAILESAPLLGAIVAVPIALFRQRPSMGSLRERIRQPGPSTAIASVLFTLLFTLLYAEQLPLFAQVTVRYLLPLYAVGVVLAVWLTPLERACRSHSRLFSWTVAAGILIGGQLLIVVVVQQKLAVGEAFQFHALLGLGLATVLAISTLGATVTDRLDRLNAAVLGLTTAAAAIFSLFVVTAYAEGIGRYPIDGDQLLPLVRVLADVVSAV